MPKPKLKMNCFKAAQTVVWAERGYGGKGYAGLRLRLKTCDLLFVEHLCRALFMVQFITL